MKLAFLLSFQVKLESAQLTPVFKKVVDGGWFYNGTGSDCVWYWIETSTRTEITISDQRENGTILIFNQWLDYS